MGRVTDGAQDGNELLVPPAFRKMPSQFEVRGAKPSGTPQTAGAAGFFMASYHYDLTGKNNTDHANITETNNRNIIIIPL